MYSSSLVVVVWHLSRIDELLAPVPATFFRFRISDRAAVSCARRSVFSRRAISSCVAADNSTTEEAMVVTVGGVVASAPKS
jgi:hypothetical protein